MRQAIRIVSLLLAAAAGISLTPQGRHFVDRMFGPLMPMPDPAEMVATSSPVGLGTLASSYTMSFESFAVPHDGGSAGSIAAHGSDIYVLSRLGTFAVLEAGSDAFRNLPLVVPVAVAPMERVFDRFIQISALGYRDLLVSDAGDDMLFTISYLDLSPDTPACLNVVVSRAVIAAAAVDSTAEADWTELYRSSPCVPAADGFFLQAGGALVLGDDGTVYVFVGDFGLDRNSRQIAGIDPQFFDSDVGKVISISPDGEAATVSIGHRNPGGFLMTSDGRLYTSEHGPRGGDELNLVRQGANYGWPLETYATHYGELTWPIDETEGLHDRFDLPVRAWVPSLAVSALAEIRGAEFPLWEGDLFMATLKNRSIRRLRIVEGRVIVDEPINIGTRIRDLAVDDAGRVYALLDTAAFVVQITNGNADVPDVPRGLAQCAGCHQINPTDATAYMGPSLVGVMGRRIGSVEGFDYSSALSNRDGRWDENSLAAFLINSQRFAPGSLMPQLDIGPTDIRFALEGLAEISQ